MNDRVIIYADTTLSCYGRLWVSNAYIVTDLVIYLVTPHSKEKEEQAYWHSKAIEEILN